MNIEATPDDDGHFHFGMTDFILSDHQEIHVMLKPSSIEQAEKILDKITGKKRNFPVQVTTT